MRGPSFFIPGGSLPEGEAFPLLLTEGGDNLLLTEGGDPLLLTEGAASSPMEIGLLGAPANTATGVVTVGPYTPVANSRLLAFALYRRGGSVTAVAKATISTEQAWTERADAVQALASPTSARATAWSTVAGTAPVPVSTVFTSSSANIIYGVVCQIPDSLLDFSNVGAGIDTVGDPNPVLAAAALADSLLIAAQVCYRIAGGVNGAAWNSLGFISAAVILEIKHV
jgi:hypothetical protein